MIRRPKGLVEEVVMAGVLDSVNQRTQLAGENRLELLLFRLGGKQVFAINVFKVREVIPCPAMTRLPNAHSIVRGIANIRGKTVPIYDLAEAIGYRAQGDGNGKFIIITEFNRGVHALLVTGVERIVNTTWKSVLPPPKGTETGSYLTAVTNIDDVLVEIIDVEKVLEMVAGPQPHVSAEIIDRTHEEGGRLRRVLIADDSSVARKQMIRVLQEIGIDCVVAKDGREALEILKGWADSGVLDQQISMVISDIEMPEMDGYTLTAEIRSDPRLKGLQVILHSSLTGVFNQSMVEKVGADLFLPKFDSNELAETVLRYIRKA